MKKFYISSILLLTSLFGWAQFAPQAGLEGSTAIHRSDSNIVNWAKASFFERGLRDINVPTSEFPTYGDEFSPIGIADGNTLSLGDGGTVIVTFEFPIKNGSGFDFAIFENGFRNPLDSTEAYLEFAFVEVSSDGSNFYRFPSVSNIPSEDQLDNFTYIDASLVHNLAGKYVAQYGTPFDLEDLKNIEGLDINKITHVKIIDVIGAIEGEYFSEDSEGNIINDPYPSNYVSGGFDLDAVAVIHEDRSNGITSDNSLITHFNLYPNPTQHLLNIEAKGTQFDIIYIHDLTGRLILESEHFSEKQTINIAHLPSGIYILKILGGKETITKSFTKL